LDVVHEGVSCCDHWAHCCSWCKTCWEDTLTFLSTDERDRWVLQQRLYKKREGIITDGAGRCQPRIARTPLELAVWLRGRFGALTYMYQSDEMLPESRTAYNRLLPALKSWLRIIRLLLAHHAVPEGQPRSAKSEVSGFKATPFMLAVQFRNFQVVNALIEHNAKLLWYVPSLCAMLLVVLLVVLAACFVCSGKQGFGRVVISMQHMCHWQGPFEVDIRHVTNGCAGQTP
jgi:hypothetical protein